MLHHSDFEVFLQSSVKHPQYAHEETISSSHQPNGSTLSSDLSLSSDASASKSNGQYSSKKNIFVCTFCQVFSPNHLTVSQHISSVHAESLPDGTKPENFVSKLQPLEVNSQKKRGKVGRPRKIQEREAIVEFKTPAIELVPDSNGLFWCKTCLRHFRKSRQLLQHICQDPEEEISSEDSLNEVDEDVEFRTHMNIDPAPWSRRKRNRGVKENTDSVNYNMKTRETEESEEITENKVVPNWRCDPSYIPLFDDEKEKAAFEEHLRSIDYSYVDYLFEVEEKRCRNKGKNNCVYVQSVVYTCKSCKKILKSLSYIRLHCLTHTDYKPFTCPKCSYKSNSKGSLYMHMRIHTGNVFSCSVCDFKCFKRSHLLDHKATHTSVYQTCKLCKNSYKTVRSLVAHIRKYHDNAGGKRYAKSLTCKGSKEFKCDTCKKKFKSVDILSNHKHACHEIPDANNLSEPNAEKLNPVIENMQVGNSNSVELHSADLSCDSAQTKDPLAEIVLNNFLQQQQQSQSIMYQNVFDHSGGNILSSSNTLLDGFPEKSLTENLTTDSSILEECQKTLNLDILSQKTLNLDILKECLQNTGFSSECQDFINRSLQNNSLSNSNRSDEKLEEPKSAEITLFEKCQRAPAYVCCVCSSIYICPATLKAHLKEHVNSSTNSFAAQSEEQFEPAKIQETTSDLDVCQILQDSSESCSYDAELEKLYTSSLDMMYYLPEVSVVLENDPALFDAVLDDLSNFPMNDNSAQDLNDKDAEESVLKCFPEL